MKTSKQKRAENEVIFRRYNEHLKRLALKVLPEQDKKDYPLVFICECSNKNCRQEISMTIEDYVKHHYNENRFILKPGHKQGDIEERVESHKTYDVVEKFQLPPVAGLNKKN